MRSLMTKVGAWHTARRGSIATAAAFAGVALVVNFSFVGELLEAKVARALEFRAREALSLAPHWSSSLVVIGFDDQTAKLLGRPALKAGEWADVLALIGKELPRAVMIDQVFRFPPEGEDADLRRLHDVLSNAGNVFAGVSMHDEPLPYHPLFEGGSKAADVRSSEAKYAYGPHATLVDAFAGFGHLHYIAGGMFRPLIPTVSGMVVPHFSALAGSQWSVFGSDLKVNDQSVPVDDRGRAWIDLQSARTYRSKVVTMAGLVERVRSGATSVNYVHPGDTVLILPLLYTGNADLDETPFGDLPRGFALASAINSSLTGHWLQPLGPAWAWILAAVFLAFLGGSVSWFRSPRLCLAWATLGAAIWTLGGVGLFVSAGIVVPWVIPAVTQSLLSMALGFRYSARTLTRTREFTAALERTLPKRTVEAVRRNPAALSREPCERVVTLMFVDIAGFSTFAERHPPRQVFELLRARLGEFTALVHAHEGIVDKSLGDGLLAIFGYDIGGREVTYNQADAAIDCAAAIQRQNVAGYAKEGSDDGTALPLRIGINTAAAYLGDLGGGERFDFTVIGAGVNYAQRLEAACEPDCVMISPATMTYASRNRDLGDAVRRRLLVMKHHESLYEAVHFDPLHGDPALKAAASVSHRKSHKLERREQRWLPAPGAQLPLKTNVGSATVVDFSQSGASIQLDKFLARGVAIDLTFDDPQLKTRMAARNIENIRAEIRWGRPATGGGHLHGVRYVNLTPTQMEWLLLQLRSVTGRGVGLAPAPLDVAS